MTFNWSTRKHCEQVWYRILGACMQSFVLLVFALFTVFSIFWLFLHQKSRIPWNSVNSVFFLNSANCFPVSVSRGNWGLYHTTLAWNVVSYERWMTGNTHDLKYISSHLFLRNEMGHSVLEGIWSTCFLVKPVQKTS